MKLLFAAAHESGNGTACVKTRLSQGRAELYSQLPSPKRSRRCNQFRQRRNSDRNSTSKFNVGVFTQPGSFATELGCQHHVRFTADNDRTADIASGPVRA